MARRFDKSAYTKGMYLHGGTFGADGRMVDIMPRVVERKAEPPAIDPRIAFLRRQTASLVEIAQKLDALAPRIREAAELVKRR
jgi:hypothetical protein